VLCPSCHRRLERSASHCGTCGLPLGGAPAPLELVLEDRTRVALVGEMTIGRAPESSIVLGHESVSRRHVRISADALLSDDGSRYGTWVDGRRVAEPVALRDGSTIRLGDVDVLVERRRALAEAGRTIVVRPGDSLILRTTDPELDGTSREWPRLRSGYKLKRLDVTEGPRRWVLQDLREDRFVRFGDVDAELIQRLDGRHSLHDLAAEAEQRIGPTGPAHLARLLADLGQRGLVAGAAASSAPVADAETGRLRRLITPRVKLVPRAGELIDAIYERGGWVLFTRPALIALAVLAVAGIAAFAGLVAVAYGTPFVVAGKIGLGGLVFLLGRLAIAGVHELAHGLTMASVGRRIRRAGLKVVVVFPYAFVDTSEAWFEPSRRRIAVSAAGPASDVVLGGVFSLACLATPDGVLRDIFFNLAFGAYVGALFNLNPLIDRDGYQMLVDALGEPGLRGRARAQLARRLSGQGATEHSRALSLYGAFGLAWTAVVGLLAIAISLRYESVAFEYLGHTPAHVLMGLLWLAFLAPAVIMVARPLLQRLRGPTATAPAGS
jgi:pSer/pThr/pTyr-binding forkhead associated (FHA) protein